MEININFNHGSDYKCKNIYLDNELEEAFTEAFLQNIFKHIHHAKKCLFDMRASKIRNKAYDMKSLVEQAIKEIEAAKNADGKLRGVLSGFSELDRITSGWKKGELIVVAARPGMGKTALALSLSLNAAVQGFPIAFFSLQISAVQLTLRLIVSEAEISGEKLKKGDLREDEWNDLNRKIKNLEDVPFFIDDTALLSIFELREKCILLAEEHIIQLIVIDNIQFIRDNNHSGIHQQDISNISRSLKALADELDIPIIVMSQLNSAVEARGGLYKPQLSDLREFGAIEQDADMVLFLYRPEYYDLLEGDISESLRGKAEIIIAKNKHGILDSVFLKFLGKYRKFVEY